MLNFSLLATIKNNIDQSTAKNYFGSNDICYFKRLNISLNTHATNKTRFVPTCLVGKINYFAFFLNLEANNSIKSKIIN